MIVAIAGPRTFWKKGGRPLLANHRTKGSAAIVAAAAAATSTGPPPNRTVAAPADAPVARIDTARGYVAPRPSIRSTSWSASSTVIRLSTRRRARSDAAASRAKSVEAPCATRMRVIGSAPGLGSYDREIVPNWTMDCTPRSPLASAMVRIATSTSFVAAPLDRSRAPTRIATDRVRRATGRSPGATGVVIVHR